MIQPNRSSRRSLLAQSGAAAVAGVALPALFSWGSKTTWPGRRASSRNTPNSTVLAHPVRIGAGNWTAVTGLLDDGSIVATVARWENGQIAKELLFDLDTGA